MGGKIIKRMVILFFIIMILFFVVCNKSCDDLFERTPSYQKAKKILDNNKERLCCIIDYFMFSDYEQIYITDSDENGVMFTGLETEYVMIENKEVIKNIEWLFRIEGIDVISKRKNTISFQKWSTLDMGSGIAYSIDGNKPILEMLTKLEIIDNNWYYYEEDYNEWRLQKK